MYRGNWRGIRERHETWWARELERPVFQVYYLAVGNGAAVEFGRWSFLKYKGNLGHLRRLLEAFADWRNIPGTLQALPDRGPLFSVNVANREEAREFLESLGM